MSLFYAHFGRVASSVSASVRLRQCGSLTRRHFSHSSPQTSRANIASPLRFDLQSTLLQVMVIRWSCQLLFASSANGAHTKMRPCCSLSFIRRPKILWNPQQLKATSSEASQVFLSTSSFTVLSPTIQSQWDKSLKTPFRTVQHRLAR